MEAGLVEMLFSFGVVLVLAIWDLMRTPRGDRNDRDDGDDSDG